MELFIFNEDYEHDDINTRIHRIAWEVENRHRFRVIDWLIDNKEPTTGNYQNIVYHMIPCLEFPSDVEEQLISVLLGENDEFLIPSECLFTEEVSDMVYKTMVQEHLDAWSDGYFEPEDLDENELAWYNEYVEYAKNNGVALR
jgi:hypothetical protein